MSNDIGHHQPTGPTGAGAVRTTTNDRDHNGPVLTVATQVRPMGVNSRFGTRPMAYACLNCGEWIHKGYGAWYDPDLDESVCVGCWPEWLTVPSGA